MSTRLGRAARGLVLLAATVTGTMVATGPADATTTTTVTAAASVYDGKLPGYDHCSDYATKVRHGIVRFSSGPRSGDKIGTVYLWWSEHCGTNYTQVVLDEPGVSGYVKVERADGRSYSRIYSGVMSYYSQMIDGRNVCVHGSASASKDRSSGGGSTEYACG